MECLGPRMIRIAQGVLRGVCTSMRPRACKQCWLGGRDRMRCFGSRELLPNPFIELVQLWFRLQLCRRRLFPGRLD